MCTGREWNSWLNPRIIRLALSICPKEKNRFLPYGSSLEDKTLFEYDGDIVIESIIATDWYGNNIDVSSVLMPKEFYLQSAYPNPFNPITNLKFGLPFDSKVSIQIYNIQGQVVSTLLNDNIKAGYHSVMWNADEFSSGIYFVQMIAGDYIHNQKIMLVK